MKFIKKVPLAVCSLSLALAALGNLLKPYSEMIRSICGILSGILLLIFLLKLVIDTDHVRKELQNSIVVGILPTATMSLLLLSVYIKPYVCFTVYIWYAAMIAQVLLMLFFAKRFLINLKLQTVFPSWLVVAAGIAVVSVTSPAMNVRPLGQAMFYLGLTLYAIILPIVLYRMIKLKDMPEPARPTLAIITAPMSLCLTGYLAAFEQPHIVVVYAMVIVALISYLYVSVNMLSLIRLKFYPTHAAFAFPYVISAIAFKSANSFLINHGQFSFPLITILSEWLAIVMVIYVIVRYAIFCFRINLKRS